MLLRKKKKSKKRRNQPAHYDAYKEHAREIIHGRLVHFNNHYNMVYKRVAIRNQKTCWGSCSEYGNLNFNYKIIFLPQDLMDYVIVHELCHITHLNHSSAFWQLVEETVPNHKEQRAHLRKMTHVPAQGFPSSIVQALGIHVH